MRYAPGLRDRGVEMTMVTTAVPGQPRRDDTSETPIVRIGPSGGRLEGPERFAARAIALAARSRPRPHVLLFLAASPLHAPLIRGLRLLGIGTLYVSTMAREAGRKRGALRQWALGRSLQWLHRSFTRSVSSTRALAADFATVGVAPDAQEIIANGVSLARFRPPRSADDRAEGRRQLGLPADETIVLYVGLIVDRKGVIDLVEAWKVYRDRGGRGRLVIVGDEQRDIAAFADFYRRWDVVVAGLGAEHAVEIRPASELVEAYFRCADLFVFLSQAEGMPNVLLEAMASGLPVLTARFAGFSGEFGRDGCELVLAQRGPEALASQLLALAGDAERLADLGANARRWVERNHDVESSMDCYAALVRSVGTRAGLGGATAGDAVAGAAR